MPDSTTSTFIGNLESRDGHPIMPLGEIRIERALNCGGIAENYLGQHIGLDFPVLVRIMKPDVYQQLGDNTIHQLVKACQQYAHVRHPNIAAVVNVGTIHNHPFSVQEYIGGIPLDERIKDRPLSEEEALKLMTPIADGLAALWKNDVVYRGVCPTRIFIDQKGEPRLDVVVLPRVPLNPVLIEAHAPFMAGFWPPEELKQSSDIDARSDMFSFGATLYYALTGTSPFGKGSKTELIVRTLTQAPADPRTFNAKFEPAVCDFIMRCLQSNPSDRFKSTEEFLNALHGMRLQLCCQATMRPSSFGPLTVGSVAKGARPALTPGEMIGQCQLENLVGAGAFGVVYKARHTLLDIPVAIKFLPAQVAEKHPDYIDLFLREARTAIRIRHKNVIGLYEAGNQNGQYYLMMEFAPNGSLLDRLQKTNGTLSEAETIRVLKDVALGLCAAEEINIIHRDIKPANLMFGSNDEIKIADLGLAKRIPNPQNGADDSSPSMRAEQLTMMRGETAIQGTPDYMAPEMAVTPGNVDIRADLYSLGVTAYQLLAGRLPFQGATPLQAIMKHVTETIPPLREFNPNVSKPLDDIIARLIEKKPENRYRSAHELSTVLAGL